VDTERTPGYRFVVFDQDHDQVGNRAVGDRLPATLAAHPHRDGLLRVAAGLVLTSPFTPMLFMGEEWGADTPWQFFSDHTDPFFADAVSSGRRSEFAAHGWAFADVPDPQDKETFLRSKLDWTQLDREPYRALLDWYRSLLALRRSRPELTDPRLDQVRVEYSENDRWLVAHRGALRVAANLGDTAVELPVTGSVLLGSAPDVAVRADAVILPAATLAVVVTSSLPASCRKSASSYFPVRAAAL
jgi:maltooligosyltrehalose trehalohydrolase